MRLLSLQEAVARCVEDPSLCFRRWGAGPFEVYVFDPKDHLIRREAASAGHMDRLLIDRPEDVFSYWRVDSLQSVERERTALWDLEHPKGPGEEKK